MTLGTKGSTSQTYSVIDCRHIDLFTHTTNDNLVNCKAIYISPQCSVFTVNLMLYELHFHKVILFYNTLQTSLDCVSYIMYSRSKSLQKHRREWRERQQRREKVKLNPLVSKCLRVMGMSRFAMSFENTSFIQFIRMPMDQYRVYGDEFASLYTALLERIEALCASAFLMLDDMSTTMSTTGPVRLDNPERNSLAVRQTCPTWVEYNTLRFDDPEQNSLTVRQTCPTWADNSPDLFADSDPPMHHTDVINTRNSDSAPKIRCLDFDMSMDNDAQLFGVCQHEVGECDRYQI